jgi:hypothetical protein
MALVFGDLGGGIYHILQWLAFWHGTRHHKMGFAIQHRGDVDSQSLRGWRRGQGHPQSITNVQCKIFLLFIGEAVNIRRTAVGTW